MLISKLWLSLSSGSWIFIKTWCSLLVPLSKGSVFVVGGGEVGVGGCSYFYLCTSNYKQSQGLPLGETAVKIEGAVLMLWLGLVKSCTDFSPLKPLRWLMREKQTSQHLADVASITYRVPADRDRFMHKLRGGALLHRFSIKWILIISNRSGGCFSACDAKTWEDGMQEGTHRTTIRCVLWSWLCVLVLICRVILILSSIISHFSSFMSKGTCDFHLLGK